MQAIKIDGLTKRYGDLVAVNELRAEIEAGETFGLLGTNGAGKSTTIRMLCCLSKPTSGDAEILGHSVVSDPAGVKKKIGVSMQETAVARNLTVRENLVFYAGLCGYDRAGRDEAVEEAIARFGFGEVLKKRAKTLSGGWQRKLSIALALVSRPEVLFLDEPTLGLDVFARRELWKTIGELKGKMTVILTTHDMAEAKALSDRVGIMMKGRLLTVDTPENVVSLTGASDFEEAFMSVIENGGIHNGVD